MVFMLGTALRAAPAVMDGFTQRGYKEQERVTEEGK